MVLMKFNEFSRFNNTEHIIVDGKETIGTWNKPSWLRELPDDKFIRTFNVNSALEGRPDIIANRVYGTPLLAWVLIAFNATHYSDGGARVGLNWPRAGMLIRYPSDSIVFPEIT